MVGEKPKDLTIGEIYFPDTGSTYLWNFRYPLKTGGAWSIFKSEDGANYSVVDSGTYTIVDPKAPRSPHVGPPAQRGPQH